MTLFTQGMVVAAVAKSKVLPEVVFPSLFLSCNPHICLYLPRLSLHLSFVTSLFVFCSCFPALRNGNILNCDNIYLEIAIVSFAWLRQSFTLDHPKDWVV